MMCYYLNVQFQGQRVNNATLVLLLFFVNLVLRTATWNMYLFCEHVCCFTLELPW